MASVVTGAVMSLMRLLCDRASERVLGRDGREGLTVALVAADEGTGAAGVVVMLLCEREVGREGVVVMLLCERVGREGEGDENRLAVTIGEKERVEGRLGIAEGELMHVHGRTCTARGAVEILFESIRMATVCGP
jgi:hypothetical protein